MSVVEAYEPGRFSWVDLMTPDAAASMRFYESLFGWSHEADHDDQGRPYTLFRLGEHRVAGMGEMSDEMRASRMPPLWNGYVTVEDLEATALRCEELGGSVRMPATPIATAGRMAILGDPEGAALSLWQPGDHGGADLVNDPGAFCWNELLTRDAESARRFYAALFGWQIRDTQAPNGYLEISNAGRSNGGMLPWTAEMGGVPAHWSVYFSVHDCDDAVKRVASLGGALLMGPVDLEVGRFAVVRDDLGAVFHVIGLNDPE